MADQPVDTKKKHGSIFSTPLAIVILGLLLWLAAGIWWVTMQVGLLEFQSQQLQQAPQQGIDQLDYATRVTLENLAWVPFWFFVLIGSVVLIVGAVRSGIYGRDVRGVPTAADREELMDLLRQTNDRLLLSETAKRVTYREHDVQSLRRVIEQDIAGGNFDAALVLVNELGQSYGYRHEAEAYRDRISGARYQEQQKKIDAAIAHLEAMLDRREFDAAAREASKLQRLYPESERVKELSQRVRGAREQYKQQLERQFLEAAESDNVDRALELLKELDLYLTEQEAEPLRETARGVIGKKRDNLGVQFKMAVHDREWTRSVYVGEQIIREFPNSRMAEEVRGMIDVLRQRSAGQQAARTGADGRPAGQPASS